MASVYPNRKNGTIVSFKFKACLGRNADGKQIFKCCTWIPEKNNGRVQIVIPRRKRGSHLGTQTTRRIPR